LADNHRRNDSIARGVKLTTDAPTAAAAADDDGEGGDGVATSSLKLHHYLALEACTAN